MHAQVTPWCDWEMAAAGRERGGGRRGAVASPVDALTHSSVVDFVLRQGCIEVPSFVFDGSGWDSELYFIGITP